MMLLPLLVVPVGFSLQESELELWGAVFGRPPAAV